MNELQGCNHTGLLLDSSGHVRCGCGAVKLAQKVALVPDVHPDHAALIAEAVEYYRGEAATQRRDLERAKANKWWGEFHYDLMEKAAARYDAIADALASAPSPRTPLPDVAFARKAWRCLALHLPEEVFRDAGALITPCFDALEAAPKVEQRTPTRDAVARTLHGIPMAYDNFTPYEGASPEVQAIYLRRADAVLALFSSPETPEPEAIR